VAAFNVLERLRQEAGVAAQLGPEAPYQAAEYPEATVIKVPVAKVLEYLPAGTPVLTPEERATHLRHRRAGAQLRRLW
jgi:hypothetical protein